MKTNIDVVIIGLNAEATLSACLESVRRYRFRGGEVAIYYVDSGSTVFRKGASSSSVGPARSPSTQPATGWTECWTRWWMSWFSRLLGIPRDGTIRCSFGC